MLRAWAAAILVWAGLLAAGIGPAAAQGGQRDPFNGQFGGMEIALSPREAARQADLFSDAVAGLAPQRPGQLDVYVLAASFWGDPVFESEATQAADILKARLGAQQRTLVLSAGTGAPTRTYPAATPFNLQAALGKIGGMIDPNEDLVVVFLTSHGAPDGSMVMRENNRLQAALRPVHLRDALADSGIRNRLVIVSACFSGAFIAPLADDRTAVLTASAPDRSSFGCQPERDWTFFGDAYFNRAIRGGAPLIQGFDQAKTLIAQWERERNLTPPSNPQRYVGGRAAALIARAEAGGR